MSADICPTVKIKTSKGFALLNESDFDPAVHALFVEPPPEPVAPVLPPPPPPPPHPLDGLAKNWQHGDPGELRKLAAAVSGRAVENKAQAVHVIEAALKARAKG